MRYRNFVDTKTPLFAESQGQSPEPARRVTAALEYARQMRLSLHQQAGSARDSRAFVHWKRLFDAELAGVREQERIRMALSRDWSDLGKYVEDNLLILRHSIALDTAGLLSRWWFAGAFLLFETSVAVILQTVIHQPERTF
jgi:hypothetical protein